MVPLRWLERASRRGAAHGTACAVAALGLVPALALASFGAARAAELVYTRGEVVSAASGLRSKMMRSSMW